MINIIWLIFLFCIISCIDFIELPKYDKIEVKANSKVYLDISSFKVNQSIYLDFIMNMFFAPSSDKSYTFEIAQVPTKSKDDNEYWNSLQEVKNNNFTKISSRDYTYSWVEIKKEEMNNIYMILPEPYSDFDFFQYKIKIENKRDMTEIKKIILYTTLSILAILTIVGISIFFYCKKKYYDSSSDEPTAPLICKQSSTDAENTENKVIQEPINESQDNPKSDDDVEKSSALMIE